MVQSLEKIAEQQRVQDARLVAIDRRFDNLQLQPQQQLSNEAATEIQGLPLQTLEQLVLFEERIQNSDSFFELVILFIFIPFC
jgi:hypothetical protein